MKPKRYYLEAVQWFKHGDHPLVEPYDGYKKICLLAHCHAPIQAHGELPSHCQPICPGSYIVTDVDGSYRVVDQGSFEKSLRPLDEEATP